MPHGMVDTGFAGRGPARTEHKSSETTAESKSKCTKKKRNVMRYCPGYHQNANERSRTEEHEDGVEVRNAVKKMQAVQNEFV